jgi:hypothetical protein
LGVRPSCHLASPGRLGRTAASPSTTLLSASEASERLREIVEGFFFRRLRTEDGKRIRRLLVKSPPGLGKTQAIKWTIRYRAEQGKGLRRLLSDLNEAGVPRRLRSSSHAISSRWS